MLQFAEGFFSFLVEMYRGHTFLTRHADLALWQQRREQILQEMGPIDRVCRGHLSEHFFKPIRRGKTVRRDPYFVLRRCWRGKNLCERIPADQVDPVRQGVEGYQRFRQLADEFVDLSEQITLPSGHLAAVKKKRPLPPTRSSSAKPTVS